MFRFQHERQRRVRGCKHERKVMSTLWHRLESTRCFSKSCAALDLDRQCEFLLVAHSKTALSILNSFHPSRTTSGNFTPVVADISPARVHTSIAAARWYTADTGMFFTAGREGTVAVWDTNAGAPVVVFSTLFEERHTIRNIAPSVRCEAHTLLAVAARHGDVVLCDVRIASSTLRLTYHSCDGIQGVQWSPVADFVLATSGDDNAVLVWDIRRARKPVHVLQPASATKKSKEIQLAFSNHGHLLASLGNDNRVELWDCASGRRSSTHFPRLHSDERMRRDMCFVSQGTRDFLIVPSVNNVYVFDTWTGSLVRKLMGHFGVVDGAIAHSHLPEVYSYSSDDGMLAWTLPDHANPTVAGPAAQGAEVDDDAWSIDEG
jgi:WD40 repeat protein